MTGSKSSGAKSSGPARPPAAFSLDDPDLRPSSEEPELPTEPTEREAEGGAEMLAGAEGRPRRAGRWGLLLVSSLGGLAVMAVSAWVMAQISQLLSAGGWLGWLALALAGLALLAFVMLLIGEIAGLLRIARVARLRQEAASALVHADCEAARRVAREAERLLARHEETAWAAARLRAHLGDVRSGPEILALAERELMLPLDEHASEIIAASARRVSVITAISPSAIVDVGFAAYENLRMLRQLAGLYAGRPGFLGLVRLARMVLAHLAVTGGVALGDDLVQQLVGHGLTQRLSARLGEGMINGTFTARIGLAALSLCRPLPYIEGRPPRLRDLLADVMRRARTPPQMNKE